MRAIGALGPHLQGSGLTMCMCFRITRDDGQEYFYAGHDMDLDIDGNLYRGDIGFSASQSDVKSGLSVDNSQLTLPYHDGGIIKSDVLVGLFYKAKLDVFWVNWESPEGGKMYEAKDWLLGRAILKENQVSFEVRSLSSYLDATVTDLITPDCPYIFGLKNKYRSKCPANLDSYKSSGTVTEIGDNPKRDFIGSVLGAPYSHGKITFTSGDNTGYSMEIESADGAIKLLLAMPYEIQTGDDYDIWLGCDKKLATCQSFGLESDFGGEPCVPSKDLVLQYQVGI